MKIRTMAQCGLFAALMCICAWVSIPFGDTVFTLQTFCLFLMLELLGGKRGSLVCLLYLLLGIAGLPVFSGFRGGLGVLLGMLIFRHKTNHLRFLIGVPLFLLVHICIALSVYHI